MARFNEILVGRFNRGLQKLTALKGPAPSPQLSSEIMPVFSYRLESDFRFLESFYRYAAFASVGAVAAQAGTIMLRNPTASNVIAVVEKVSCRMATGGVAVFQSNPAADLANAVTTIPLDNRQGITGNASALKVSTTTLAGLPVGANQIDSLGAAAFNSMQVIQTPNQEIPLPPGAGLIFQDTVNNEQAITSLWWRERFLEDSERTG